MIGIEELVPRRSGVPSPFFSPFLTCSSMFSVPLTHLKAPFTIHHSNLPQSNVTHSTPLSSLSFPSSHRSPHNTIQSQLSFFAYKSKKKKTGTIQSNPTAQTHIHNHPSIHPSILLQNLQPPFTRLNGPTPPLTAHSLTPSLPPSHPSINQEAPF